MPGSKYSPERVQRICQALRLGATYELAANYGGISYATFRDWRNGRGIPKRAHAPFLQALKDAEAAAAVGWLAKIEAAANDGAWQAAAWKLERRYPDAYGRREPRDPDPGGGVTIQLLQAVIVGALKDHPDARAAVAETLLSLSHGAGDGDDDSRT